MRRQSDLVFGWLVLGAFMAVVIAVSVIALALGWGGDCG